jgi:hypothetical protein
LEKTDFIRLTDTQSPLSAKKRGKPIPEICSEMSFSGPTFPLCFGILALVTGLGHAQEPLASHSNWHLHQEDRAWLQASDPTLLAPRLTTQWEHEDLAEGNRKDKIFVNLREAWRLTDSLALGFQAELPIRWAKIDGDRFAGLGDTELRTGLVGRFLPGLRWAFATNVRFDTASESPLGAGGFQWRPNAALRWDARRWLTLGLQSEYTFAEDADKEFFQLKLPISVELGQSWSAEVVYQPKWTQDEDSRRIDLVEFTVVHRFGRDKRYAFLTAIEVPLSEDELDWKASVGVQWYFR